MNIWFDISNSPHVNMFKDMITELRERHEVIVTCRDLANTISLLRLHNIPYETVGKHYGKSLVKKTLGYPIRVIQLGQHIKTKKIDVAISQSSFHSPLVSRTHGVPSIYLNDNEHALGNLPAFAFATTIMVPEHMSDRKLRSQFARRNKLIKYPGVKEGIYLWKEAQKVALARLTRPRSAKPVICIRPEPSTAQYYRGKNMFLDPLIEGLAGCAEVRIFPRDREQETHYRANAKKNITVNSSAVDLLQISSECDVFVGAGGTMTREMAVLGVPTISVYQDDLLDVDRFLIREGAMLHNPAASVGEVMDLADQRNEVAGHTVLLEKGRVAYKLIMSELMRFEN